MTSLVIKLCHLGALGRRGYTGAKQMVCSRHPPRPLFVLQHFQRWSSFHADFQAFSKRFRQKWFSTCLPKGGLVHWPRIMGFHWGRVTRRRVFFWGGSQLAEWRVVFWGQEAQVNATQPPSSAYLSRTYTHRSTYNADEQSGAFTACAFTLHAWRVENRVRLFGPNVFSVIRMTRGRMNLKSSRLNLTAQHFWRQQMGWLCQLEPYID